MFALTKLNLAITGGVLALVLALSGVAYVKHLQHQAREAHAAKVTAKALDHLATQTQINQEKADDAVNAIRQAPGAETSLPPDVVARHRLAIQRLRDHKHP